jgi:hypothetical protein
MMATAKDDAIRRLSSVSRPELIFTLLACACGPRIEMDREDPDDFPPVAEAAVDAFCSHNQECKAWWNENGDTLQGRQYHVFEHTPECYDPLLSGVERMYATDRCTDPDALLALLECVAAVPCPSYQTYRTWGQDGSYDPCARERAAVDAASCDPF